MNANPWDLTDRQAEILRLLATSADGCNKSVARTLGISPKTVEAHLQRACEKLKVQNRMQAVLVWDRTERETQLELAKQEANAAQERARQGFEFCPTCGGFGFVRRAA